MEESGFEPVQYEAGPWPIMDATQLP